MKDVPLKFRVKGINGNVYFGYISSYDFMEVEPDSIAQLVGYDADGNEVYEGDKLFDIIATCITRLDILGYDSAARQKLFQAVNDKNEKRGYFED